MKRQPSTIREAQDEAKRRWGKNGTIQWTNRTDGRPDRYTVGHVVLGMLFQVEGQGESWEAAFADADAKRKGTKEGGAR